ncbi:LPS assembly protein LptD [Aristophania vespae]|uniref:LPS-assembly protein LptD n=1 Tax=Aristophania vespae TaxID=2697033 RepID=A0A6P1NFR0_9PROT|nr:LPS assembly protein LptD [Aristophania vespae]
MADHESYDKTGLIIWKGNVRVWQGDQALRADKITYDRASGIMTANGHVAFVQQDGSTTYADHIELTQGLKDGIGSAVYMRMQQNAKLAATGLRRTSGVLNDFSNVVYTACALCEKNPDLPPFWQIQAYGATQDKEHTNIEFNHAWLKMLGIPVFYFPYFAVTDPTVKRHNGFLIPNISPHDRYLGTYFTIPYFWDIDDQQDITFEPLVATKTGPQLSAIYRNRLNFGRLKIKGGVADDTRRNSPYTNPFGQRYDNTSKHGAQGYIFANGDFAINRHWYGGFDVNVASSANYMRDYRIPGYGNDTLGSNIYVEGYGVGSFLRLDAQGYQGLNRGIINNSELPFALPRLTYEFQGEPDPLGGRLSVHSTDFFVYRSRGAVDQRGELALQWDRPFHNNLGQQWLLTGRVDTTLYHAKHLEEQPNYGHGGGHVRGFVLPTVALKMNWPFLRTFAKGHGSQIFEPIIQLIAAPNMGNSINRNLPNEDSLTYEFTDTTLFALNRYMGTDRLDSGLRANVGIHQNWSWNGHSVDMLVGESFQEHIDRNRLPYSGLDHHVSDPIGRITITPNQYVDLTARGRYNPWRGNFDYGEALLSTGLPFLRFTGGYVYEPITPYYLYRTNYRRFRPNLPSLRPTNELTGRVTAKIGQYHVSAYTRRAMQQKKFVANGGDVGYENDCFGLDVIYIRQYTYVGGEKRNSTVLLNFFFKTIGTFGVNG